MDPNNDAREMTEAEIAALFQEIAVAGAAAAALERANAAAELPAVDIPPADLFEDPDMRRRARAMDEFDAAEGPARPHADAAVVADNRPVRARVPVPGPLRQQRRLPEFAPARVQRLLPQFGFPVNRPALADGAVGGAANPGAVPRARMNHRQREMDRGTVFVVTLRPDATRWPVPGAPANHIPLWFRPDGTPVYWREGLPPDDPNGHLWSTASIEGQQERDAGGPGRHWQLVFRTPRRRDIPGEARAPEELRENSVTMTVAQVRAAFGWFQMGPDSPNAPFIHAEIQVGYARANNDHRILYATAEFYDEKHERAGQRKRAEDADGNIERPGEQGNILRLGRPFRANAVNINLVFQQKLTAQIKKYGYPVGQLLIHDEDVQRCIAMDARKVDNAILVNGKNCPALPRPYATTLLFEGAAGMGKSNFARFLVREFRGEYRTVDPGMNPFIHDYLTVLRLLCSRHARRDSAGDNAMISAGGETKWAPSNALGIGYWIIDEFVGSGQGMTPSLFKLITDPHGKGCQFEVKGGMTLLTAHTVVITTNRPMEQWQMFRDAQSTDEVDALCRRIPASQRLTFRKGKHPDFKDKDRFLVEEYVDWFRSLPSFFTREVWDEDSRDADELEKSAMSVCGPDRLEGAREKLRGFYEELMGDAALTEDELIAGLE